jgi:hypothetical protein
MATKKKIAVDPKLQRWKRQGESLAKAKWTNQWAIAKWMCEGEDGFKRSKPYQLASTATGMTVETLRQFAYTARNVKVSTRVNSLSFGHHRLVAGYTPDQQVRYLKHAKNNKKSVASFAAYLKGLKQDDASGAEERSEADVAAAKVIEACSAFLRNYNFDKLLSEPPTDDVRADVLDELKKAVAELNEKIETLTAVWQEIAEADAAFLAASPKSNTKAVGAGQ